MTKFRFYQDKEVKTWVRDFYNVEAETLEEAIEYVKNMGCTFDDDECKPDTRAEFIERDMDLTLNCITEYEHTHGAGLCCIFSCDLENEGQDGEVLTFGRE